MSYPQAAGTPTVRRPARVLFLHASNELYGSDLVLLNLLRGLDRRFIHPIVVLPNDLQYEGLLSRELEVSGIDVRSLPIAVIRRRYFTPRGLPEFLWRLERSTEMINQLIRQEHISLVHTNTQAVWTGATAARRAHIPHIWHTHELVEHPKPLLAFLRRFVPSHSVRVLSVCQLGIDHLLVTPQARAKGSVLYNGLNGQDWLPTDAGRSRIRQEIGAQPDDIVVGMITRISRLKAPDVLASAIGQLMDAQPRLRCFIAGSIVPGQEDVQQQLEAAIAATPHPERIHLLGYRRDAPDLMAGLDILVHPSREPESISMTVLQGMFAGRPVVTTDLGGVREAVSDSVTGFLIPPDDPTALAQRIQALVVDAQLRRSFGQAGQQRAYAQFTLEEQRRRFNQLLWQEYVAAQRQR